MCKANFADYDQVERLVIPQRYINEAKEFLANAEDETLIEIIAEAFYLDDMGEAA